MSTKDPLTPTPHDALFKGIFSNPQHAASLLRNLFAQSPATSPLLDKLDLSALTPLSPELVDKSLRTRQADLLFSVPFKRAQPHDEPLKQAVLYLMMEHLSSFPFRFICMHVLGRMLRFWEGLVQQNPDLPALPVIVPVLIYHGQQPWRHGTQFAHEFDLPVDAQHRIFLPDFSIMLKDLQSLDAQQIQSQDMDLSAKTALGMLKLPKELPLLEKQLPQWNQPMEALRSEQHVEDLQMMLNYVIHQMVTRGLNVEQARERLAELLSPPLRSDMISLAQALENKGEQRGLQLGIRQGKAEGEARGKAQAVLAVLRARGFHPTSSEQKQILGCTELSKLEQWVRRAATVSTLSEVFGPN